MNMNDITCLGVNAALAAGKLLLTNFGKISHIEQKGDRDFVTNLDKEAEQLIVDKIKKKFPAHGIFAEESGASGLHREYLWIIDPLDGTHNFIHNIDIFGVSIGVVHKGEFVTGVIYMPKDNELYVAEKASGSYKNNKRISVSSTERLKECSISFDSSIRYAPQRMLEVLGRLAKNVFNIRMFGSSVRVLSYVAEGKLDFAVEFYDRPWDFAAGACIIQEAGGKITTLKGKKLTYKTIGYIASNKVSHDKAQSIVQNDIS